MTTEFRIICASNASIDIYPDNTLSKFKNRFSAPVDLSDGNWHVALQTLCFNASFNGDFPDIILVHMLEIKAFLGGSKILYVAPFTSREKLPNDGYYCEPLQKQFIKVSTNSLSSINIRLTDENGVQLSLAEGQPTFVELNFRKMSDSTQIIRFSSEMSKEFFPNNSSSRFKVRLPTPLTLNNYGVALSTIHFPLLSNNYGTNPPIAILLHADIVAPTIIGTSYVKIIKLFPCAQDGWLNIGSYECRHLTFIPIQREYIDTITFTLLDAAGRELIFEDDSPTPTFITLVFQKN
jgi:hypothetical protein